MSNSVLPHRQQPMRLPCPWDSPGKNTGVGCHFLLQCMKVKSESKFTQSCPTLSDPMDCSPPGSSIHGIFQARVLEWGAISFSDYLSRFHIYALIHDICFPLSDISLELTQICSFLWLNIIPLYICTTASLYMHLLMDI